MKEPAISSNAALLKVNKLKTLESLRHSECDFLYISFKAIQA